jgi:enamine deaminase RidA (YjgF/YER057c/UK114 family)
MRRFVNEGPDLPEWTSPIAHAVVVGDTCYLSGQLSLGKDGSYIAGTAREEAERAFGNLFAAVREAGFAVSDLVFIDVAFVDLGDAPVVNALYMGLFPEGRRPARTMYQAAALPFGGRVKVMGVAIRER